MSTSPPPIPIKEGSVMNPKATWRDSAIGTPRELDVPHGKVIAYEAGNGDPIVFVHGVLVNANLWRKVIASLSPDFHTVALDLPLGSHTQPVNPDADLSPHGLADLIADSIEALGLENVTLVGNDTGGALCQMVVTRRPERIGRLVLTSSDYRDYFPPPMFGYLKLTARIPGATRAMFAPMRVRFPRHLPFAFGWLVKHTIDRDAEDSYVYPVVTNKEIARDVRKALTALDKRYTNEAADRLGGFEKPALIAWSKEDKFFNPELAEALARSLPNARLEWVEDARTFSMEDNPGRVAELIAGFVREPAGAAAVAP
jgi:pimeloyl-ACP methyl ester carboxylesterase